MSVKNKLTTAAGTVALIAGLAVTGNAIAQNADLGPDGPAVFDRPNGDELAQRGRAGRRFGGPRGPSLAERFDTNGDGQITEAEIEAAQRARLAEFDSNGDGVLSLGEFEDLWRERNRGRLVDAFQRLDDDGDAAVTFDEFGISAGQLVARLDRDGNGVIGPDEQRPPRRGRPGGPRGQGPGGQGPGR